MNDPSPPVWHKPDGSPVSCLEKIKVLNENFAELKQAVQDLLDDALLMGCSEAQVRAALSDMVDKTPASYDENPDAI